MRTPEELERLAYINGQTEIAKLLAQMIDMDYEIRQLDTELATAEKQMKEAQS